MQKGITASLFVDPQNGFTPLCPNELPVTDGNNIVTALNEQLKYARLKACSKDAHNIQAVWVANENQKQYSPVNNQEDVDVCWNAHCMVGTYGFELLEGLPKVKEYDYFVWKGIELNLHPYGACYHDFSEKLSTGLIEYFTDNSIRNVIVGGLATEYCVKLSAIQLSKYFNVFINLEGCRGITSEGVEKAIVEMQSHGIVIVKTLTEVETIFG